MNTFEDFDNTVIENERAMNIEVFSTHYLKRCKKLIDSDRLDDSNSIFQEFNRLLSRGGLNFRSGNDFAHKKLSQFDL